MKISFRSTFLQYVTVQLVGWYCSAFIILQLFCSSLNMIVSSTKLGRKKSVGSAVSNENCAMAVHSFMQVMGHFLQLPCFVLLFCLLTLTSHDL